MEKKKKTKYISLAEASDLCRYSQDYLSLRARQGKLRAVKRGRNWTTTREWLSEYLKEFQVKEIKYISLAEASDLCRYSQDYLSLRARQGKLRAVKRGRNWTTTREWLSEYLRKFQAGEELEPLPPEPATIEPLEEDLEQVFVEPASEKAGEIMLAEEAEKTEKEKEAILAEQIKEAKRVREAIFAQREERAKKAVRSLRCEEKRFRASAWKDVLWRLREQIVASRLPLRLQLCRHPLISLVLLVGFCFLAANIFIPVATDKTTLGQANSSIKRTLLEITDNPAELAVASFYQAKGGALEVFWQGGGRVLIIVRDMVYAMADGAVKYYEIAMDSIFKSERIVEKPADLAVVEKTTPKTEAEKARLDSRLDSTDPRRTAEREGVIVVPSTDRDEEVKQKIRDSFSDEVKVEIEDDSSGIITPIFREREGDRYLYMMVPISEAN